MLSGYAVSLATSRSPFGAQFYSFSPHFPGSIQPPSCLSRFLPRSLVSGLEAQKPGEEERSKDDGNAERERTEADLEKEGGEDGAKKHSPQRTRPSLPHSHSLGPHGGSHDAKASPKGTDGLRWQNPTLPENFAEISSSSPSRCQAAIETLVDVLLQQTERRRTGFSGDGGQSRGMNVSCRKKYDQGLVRSLF